MPQHNHRSGRSGRPATPRFRSARRNLSLFAGTLLLAAQASSAKTVVVGGSGGTLSYPNAQTTLALGPGDTIAIQAGTYAALNFGKLQGTAQAKIAIVNRGGVVEITGSCSSCSSSLTDAVNVAFSGTGSPDIEYGFSFHDLPYRALQLNGHLDSTSIDHCRFVNVADYVVRINANMVYDGTPATILQGLKFSHLFVKNSGAAIDWGDYAAAANLIGVGRDIEIFDNIVDSSQQGTGFRLNKVFEANVHHNTISRMGLGLTSTHPGIVMLRGDGRVHHNDIRDVWGVCSRNFGCGLGRTGKVDVYDNIFIGSRKYSAIEANSLFSDTTSRASSPYVGNCDYRFFNNTIGNQKAADFSSAMVDVYTLLGGRCEIKNNLGFHIAMDKPYNPATNYVYNLENPNPPDTARNLYRPDHADLGLQDTLQVRLLPGSIAIDHGLDLALVTDDFAGIPRPKGLATDIGAREFVPSTVIGAHRSVAAGAIHLRATSAGLAVESAAPLRRVGITGPDGRSTWLPLPSSDLRVLEIPGSRLGRGLHLLRIETDDRSEVRRWIAL